MLFLKYQINRLVYTIEFELIALAATGMEVKWLRNLLLVIKLIPQQMPSSFLQCDSRAIGIELSARYTMRNQGILA